MGWKKERRPVPTTWNRLQRRTSICVHTANYACVLVCIMFAHVWMSVCKSKGECSRVRSVQWLQSKVLCLSSTWTSQPDPNQGGFPCAVSDHPLLVRKDSQSVHRRDIAGVRLQSWLNSAFCKRAKIQCAPLWLHQEGFVSTQQGCPSNFLPTSLIYYDKPRLRSCKWTPGSSSNKSTSS